MRRLTAYLDSIADRLEARGLLKEACEIDVISNTIDAGETDVIGALDLMTQPAKATQRENMEELNYAGQFAARTQPRMALQAFVDYWGQEYGPSIYELARRKAGGEVSQQLSQAWQAAVQKARGAKARMPKLEPDPSDPFMSPAERAQVRKPAPQPTEDIFTRE